MKYQYEFDRREISQKDLDKLVKWLKKLGIHFAKTDKSVIIQHDEYYFIYRFDKVITAIKAGFEFEEAIKIITDGWELYEIDVKRAADKNPNVTSRLLSRIIGEKGKTISNLEKYTKAKICVNDKKIYIIGDPLSAQSAFESVRRLIKGSSHSRVYDFAVSYKRHLRNKEKEIRQNIYL
jgi:KH domain-containing protein